MTILLALSIAVSFGFGFLLMGSFWPATPRPLPLLAVLALPAGWAATSVMYFLWLILSGGRSGWYPAVETIALGVGIFVFLKSIKKNRDVVRWKLGPDRSAVAAFLLVLAATGISFAIPLKRAGLNPWGYWDAWARINVKARFLFAGGDQWTWIFESRHIFHHDYPLFMASSVARAWSWMGEITLTGPQVLSLSWGIWSVVILFSVTSWMRGPLVACIITLTYLTFSPLLIWTSAQYSDIPLACYMVLCCSMLAAAGRHPESSRGFGFLAGFFAGSAAWCKNEGIAFLALIVLWWMILWIRKRLDDAGRATGFFLAGMGSPIIAVLTLKFMAIARGTEGLDETSASGFSALSLVLDGGRHLAMMEQFWQILDLLWCGWPLLPLATAFVLLQLGCRPRTVHVGALSCAIAQAGIYYLVLVTTGFDLSWQLTTAMDRLILQIWPAFLFGLAVFFGKAQA